MGDFLGKNGKNILFMAGFAVVLLLIFEYLLPLTAPFIVSFIIVYLCFPWLKRIQQKTHIRKEVLLGGLLLLIAALLGCSIWGMISWTTVHAAEIGDGLIRAQKQLDSALHDCCAYLEAQFGLNAAYAEGVIIQRLDHFAENMQSDALPKMAGQSWEYLKEAAAVGAFLGVGFISSMLLCRDYEGILDRLEGNQIFDLGWKFVEKTVALIGGYLKAQIVILLVISVLAAAGLLIGRVGGAVFLGILAGMLDALPFIGTGIVLLPTALWQLLSGNIWGAALAALTYVLCIAARELLEPKLLGKQVGMYPVVMLFAVYAGVRVFGLSGIFLGPLYIVLLREGIDMFKSFP